MMLKCRLAAELTVCWAWRWLTWLCGTSSCRVSCRCTACHKPGPVWCLFTLMCTTVCCCATTKPNQCCLSSPRHADIYTSGVCRSFILLHSHTVSFRLFSCDEGGSKLEMNSRVARSASSPVFSRVVGFWMGSVLRHVSGHMYTRGLFSLG